MTSRRVSKRNVSVILLLTLSLCLLIRAKSVLHEKDDLPRSVEHMSLSEIEDEIQVLPGFCYTSFYVPGEVLHFDHFISLLSFSNQDVLHP